MNGNKVIRAWIYDLLATLELQEVEDAHRTETGNKIIIEVTLK